VKKREADGKGEKKKQKEKLKYREVTIDIVNLRRRTEFFMRN
jgi:hypothetical protein